MSKITEVIIILAAAGCLSIAPAVALMNKNAPMKEVLLTIFIAFWAFISISIYSAIRKEKVK